MKQFLSFRKSTVLLLIIFILGNIGIYESCVKDYTKKKFGGLEWDPNLAVPLVYSSITVRQILAAADKHQAFQIGSDNFVTLVFRGELFSIKASDFLVIPDTSLNNTQALSAADVTALNAVGSASIPISQNVTVFTLGNTRADSIVLNSGTMQVVFNPVNLPFTGTLVVTIPSITLNGIPLSSSAAVTASGPSTLNFDLTGSRIVMNSPAPPDNQITINATLNLTGTPGTASGSSSLAFDYHFNQVKFGKFFGFIDQPLLSPDMDTVSIDLFRNSLGGGVVTVVDPKFTIDITNSYGVPISAGFEILNGYNPNRTPSLSPIAYTNGSPLIIPINAPNISQIGQSVSSSFFFDKSNSNIVDVLNATPPMLIYKVHSQANPNGPPSSPNTNFVLDTSRFKVDAEISLPLYGTANGFTFQDTVASFTLASPDQIDFLLLRTSVTNGFPAEAKIQVIFADSSYNKLDSLVTNQDPIILPAAGVDAGGRVNSPTSKTTDCVISSERMKNLHNLKYLLVRADARSTNGANVKIYSDYKIDLRMGVQAKLKLKIALTKDK